MLAILAGKLAARRTDCAPLAGKSTLNRLEHAPAGEPGRYHRIGHDAAAIEALFVDLFLEAHRKGPPRQIILDLDATDVPLHGHQEGRFFHGYYDAYCYLPLYVFCGRHLLAARLRRANIDASAGALEEVARIVGQIRARWPRVRILLRADSGFAREALMAWCEAHRVDFVFGLARNARLVEELAIDLAWAEEEATCTGRPARRFRDFRWSTLDSWSRRRRVIGKAEWTRGAANPRFIVTSLCSAEIDARSLYERIYCARGEMENRMYGRLPPCKCFLRSFRHDQVSCCNVSGLDAATWPRASMRSASWLPIIKASSRLFGSLGLCQPRSDRSCHRVKEHPRSSWKRSSLAGEGSAQADRCPQARSCSLIDQAAAR